MAQGKGRFRVLGVVALAIGVLGALALWLIAGKRYDDAVESLAPAPVGCDTTLVFDRAGTYTFFVETTGSVGEIEGDCAADDTVTTAPDDDAPRVELALTSADGSLVDLNRVDGPSYDRAGARGRGFRTAEIDTDGEYVLSVSADAEDVMVRVGGATRPSGVVPLRHRRRRGAARRHRAGHPGLPAWPVRVELPATEAGRPRRRGSRSTP